MTLLYFPNSKAKKMYVDPKQLAADNFHLREMLRLIAEIGDNMALTNAQSVEYMTDLALHALGDTNATSFFEEHGWELDGFIEELAHHTKIDEFTLRRLIKPPE